MNHRLIVIGLLACAACHRQAANVQPQQSTYISDGSVLYRVEAGGRTALLALDSATAPAGVPVAPSRWTPQPGSTFGVAATTFRNIAASPDGAWVAWESSGAVHDLLGLSPARGGKFKVLDFYFDSAADSLRWAPDGRYLKVFYTPPSGVAEVRVYDAALAKRIK